MTKTKEIKVKERKEKISKKHLQQMQGLINTINAIQFNIGKMEVQKQQALDEMKTQQKSIGAMQDVLVREYGTFDVNINDGSINWPEDPEQSLNSVDKPKEDEK
tara:strand:- start:745 stop:1056 length:312 start_codon:yes stop_codon:yes gene_type:complete